MQTDETTTDAEPDETIVESENEVTEEQPNEEPDTFPRSYVEELRQENGKYRQRAQRADAYAQRLHVELVRATASWPTPPTSSSMSRT
jgi:hypothetical protein